MSVLCANNYVSTQARMMCGELMAAVGDTAWVEDEAMMDAVTAVSGSGPAYVFWLIECLAEAGQNVGLPAALSRQLALETVAGAGELARQSEETPSQLRLDVSSPGGTTLAAPLRCAQRRGAAALPVARIRGRVAATSFPLRPGQRLAIERIKPRLSEMAASFISLRKSLMVAGVGIL